MLKSCSREPSGSNTSNTTSSTRQNSHWSSDAHLSSAKALNKDDPAVFHRAVSISSTNSGLIEADIPIYQATMSDADDTMVHGSNPNSHVLPTVFQPTMGTQGSFDMTMARWMGYMKSQAQKTINQKGLRQWEDPVHMQKAERRWKEVAGMRGGLAPTSKGVKTSSSMQIGQISEPFQAIRRHPTAKYSGRGLAGITFLDTQSKQAREDDTMSMDDADIPPDSDDEEDQLQSDDDLPAPYIEPLDQPLDPQSIADAKILAHKAYYGGRQRKQALHRRARVTSNTRAKRNKNYGDRLKIFAKRVRKAVKNGVSVSYVEEREPGQAKLVSSSGAVLGNRSVGGSSNAVAGPSNLQANGEKVPAMPAGRMIEWVAELHKLKGMAEQGLHTTAKYASDLEVVLHTIEQHENHPEFTVDRLKKNKLFTVLKEFQHLNNGRGPGVESLKARVVALCKRWRKRLNPSND